MGHWLDLTHNLSQVMLIDYFQMKNLDEHYKTKKKELIIRINYIGSPRICWLYNNSSIIFEIMLTPFIDFIFQNYQLSYEWLFDPYSMIHISKQTMQSKLKTNKKLNKPFNFLTNHNRYVILIIIFTSSIWSLLEW